MPGRPNVTWSYVQGLRVQHDSSGGNWTQTYGYDPAGA